MRRLFRGNRSSLSSSSLLNGHPATMCFSVSWNEIQCLTLSAHECDTQHVSTLHRWLKPQQSDAFSSENLGFAPALKPRRECTHHSGWDSCACYSGILNETPIILLPSCLCDCLLMISWRLWHELLCLRTKTQSEKTLFNPFTFFVSGSRHINCHLHFWLTHQKHINSISRNKVTEHKLSVYSQWHHGWIPKG